MPRLIAATLFLLSLLAPASAWASNKATAIDTNLINHPLGWFAVTVFSIAMVLAMLEHKIHMRKSKPLLTAAFLTWVPFGVYLHEHYPKDPKLLQGFVMHGILDYSMIFLFLLVAMTFVNSIEERGVFEWIKSVILERKMTWVSIFWATGALCFGSSSFADNMTAALFTGMIVAVVGESNPKFVATSGVNIVVAANAGGVWSPFGDLTSYMFWDAGKVKTEDFAYLIIPALIVWLIPAIMMSLTLPKGRPDVVFERVEVRPGGWVMVGLFLGTIVTALALHIWIHMPAAFTMMGGLGVLKVYGYILKKRMKSIESDNPMEVAGHEGGYDIFKRLEKAEWDTLLFFYGLMMCVGLLTIMGFLHYLGGLLYGPAFGPTNANVLAGIISAVIDNVGLAYALLKMELQMSEGQWLLATLTCGVGGSLLSLGSAAGVALMGQLRGVYTFSSHLRWTPAIFLGYVGGVAFHIYVNGVG